ncbi:MAG TPA: hypothetical protein VGQ09_11090 [Chitinophagaceae bacterium]|jgi:uncharacterized membrane protein HdeD (DUF308 family)|nr:hypothetical protein [Chitinophagaceae bacterium]
MQLVTGIFLIVFGAISLIFGILNKRTGFWMSLYDGTEKSLGKNHTKVWNIVSGIVSVFLGILIVLNHFKILVS